MKTNEELLKFYGVELNKKYIITKKSDRAHADVDVGEKFRVFIGNSGSKELHVHFEESDYYCYLHVLNGFSYKPCPEEVLDKEEKEYLRTVIKPFRNKYNISIVKFNYTDNNDDVFEYISIRMYVEDIGYITNFPMFSKGTMYKGMKVNNEYTPEELGL